MLRRPLPHLIFGVISIALCAATLAAQKGGKKPPPPEPAVVPGTVVIRCASEGDASADVICADGSDTYVDSTLPGGDPGVTVQMGSGGNFIWRTSDVAGLTRAHVVRIPGRAQWEFEDCNPQCVANIPEGGLIVYTDPSLQAPENAYVEARTDAGLVTMLDGQTVAARMLMGFPDPQPESNVRWSLYWNPEYYAGTNYGVVTRSGCTWTMRADESALAGLWLFRVGKGKYANAQEGRFTASLEVVFTADPSACQTDW